MERIEQMQVVPPLAPPRTYEELLAAIDKAHDSLKVLHSLCPEHMVWNDHLKKLLALQERWLTLSIPAPPFVVSGGTVSFDGFNGDQDGHR